MNIFKLEFKKKIKSMLIWEASILAWALIVVSFIPMIVDQGENFVDILDSMGAFGDVFNINSATFSTVLGIIGMYFGMLLIVFGIQAANYGFSLVTVEEAELTADFLLTKPVKRSKIITNKILASVAIMFITCVIYVLVTYFSVITIASNYTIDKKALLLILATAFFVQLFFFSLSILISLFLKKVKSVTPFSMGLVFGLFILSAFARTFEIEFIKYINPFSYFETATIAQNATLDTKFFIINLCVVLVSIAISYLLYRRRDIQSV